MKVRELIAVLQEHDPDAEVVTEGCDCYGDVGAVEAETWAAAAAIRPAGPFVLLRRSEEGLS